MRMMGADSVGYHERTVLGREDDPVGNALAYYASRGETPMAWGGAGAAGLGLDGEVDLAEWRACSALVVHATRKAASVSCTACGRGWSSL
jgi:hypothetical protein